MRSRSNWFDLSLHSTLCAGRGCQLELLTDGLQAKQPSSQAAGMLSSGSAPPAHAVRDVEAGAAAAPLLHPPTRPRHASTTSWARIWAEVA